MNRQFIGLKESITTFVCERNWLQFHSPKNLVMALTGECGELCAEFQFLTENESKHLTYDQRARVEDEIGDVFIYFTELCDILNIDPFQCAHNKLEKNKEKYPAHLVRGSAKKYTEYSNNEV